jgi:ABC-type uncharacterized transport system YnjBCD ATPase subunit
MTATLSEGQRLVRLIELTNLAIAALAVVAVHVFAGPGTMLWGAVAGAAICVLNLRAMVFLGRKLLTSTPDKRRVWGVLFAAKLIVLGTVVWLALRYLPLDSIGFLIGFSALLPAGLVATSIRALERSTPVPPTTHGERRL